MTASLSRRPRRLNRLLGSTTLELVLRVQSGEHQGSEVRIRSSKCTIGSAPGCTLRLAARGIRPLHCWILRGPGGTIVRRRDPHTRLNGRPFQDAPLTPGDRLQIGPIELEVCQCPIVPVEWTLGSADLPEPMLGNDLEWEAAQRELLASSQAAERLREELHALENRATQQLDTLNDLVSRVSLERDDFSQRLVQLQATASGERDQLSQRLRTIETEAASERDSLLLDKQQLELTLAANQQQLDELRSHLSGREAEIESLLHAESRRVADVQTRLEQVVRERAKLESLLQQQAGSLRDDSEAHRAECDRLQGECLRLESQLAQLREQVGYTTAERDTLTVRLEGRQLSLTHPEQLLAQDKAELQRRLDAALAELADAERRLAVLQVEGDHRLKAELERACSLEQRLDQTLADKTTLERQLQDQTSVWHSERESLRQQTERVTDHCKQVEGQLTHVRDLVESLASDRDSLCQQLEAAEIKLAAEQQQWHEQRSTWESQIREFEGQGAERQRLQEEQSARIAAEAARADEWQQRAEQAEQQLTAASQQVAAASEQFSLLRSESEHRLHDESGRASQLAQDAAQSREQLSATQMALADAETRLTALQTEHEVRLRAEQERAAVAELRASEASRELAAADLRLAEAERRLSAFRTQGDARLNTEIQKGEECARHLDDALQQLAALRERQSQEAAQTASLRVELDALQAAQQHGKEATATRWEALQQQLVAGAARLAESQSEFEQRLQVEAEKANDSQRQLIGVQEQLDAARQQLLDLEHRTAEMEAQHAMQIATEQQRSSELEQQFKASESTGTELESRLLEQTESLRFEHESWDNDRQHLQQRVAELEQQLANQKQFSEGMTLGNDAIAQLQAQSKGETGAADLDELRGQMAAMQSALADALPWRDRCQSAEEQLGEQRTVAHQLTEEVELLKQRLLQAEQGAGNSASSVESPSAEQPDRRQITEEREFLEAARQEFERERKEFQNSQGEFESQWRTWEESLRSKEELLNRQAQELADRLERAAARQAEFENERAELARQLAVLVQPPVAAAKLPLPQEHSAREPVLNQPADSAEPRGLESAAGTESPRTNETLRQLPAPGDEHSQAQRPDESIARGKPAAEPGVDPRQPSALRISERHKPVWTQPDAPARPADDDSIEAYMARLLKRVRGDAPPAPHPFLPLNPPPAPVAAGEAERKKSAAPAADSIQVPEEPAQREEFLPRYRAPELAANLAAMRELANSAARTAIVKHQRKSGSQLAFAQSIGAVLTLLCSCAAGYFAVRTQSLYAGIGAAIGGLAACYWGGKAVRHALKALLLRVPVVESLVLPDSEPEVAEGQPEESPVDAMLAALAAEDASNSATGELAETAASERGCDSGIPALERMR